MRKLFFLLFLVPILGGCQNLSQKSTYLKSVGDISYDSAIDKKDFILCDANNIKQYHNNHQGLEYKGEKIAIMEEFNKKYIPVNDKNCNGLVRVRFLVNCKGETDRFRAISMNEEYKETTFDSKIIEQLLTISKSLNGWIPKIMEGKEIDYYQYLIFKMKDGQIIEILP